MTATVSADGVQQVAGAVAMHAGNGDQLAQAQAVEIVQLHGRLADLVALVDSQHYGLAAAHQHAGDVLVLRGHTGRKLSDHDDAICGIDGQLGLLTHVGQQAIVDAGFDTAGIDYREGSASPLGFAVYTVPRYAGNILNYCAAFAYKFIEKRTFTDIRSSYDRYYRF